MSDIEIFNHVEINDEQKALIKAITTQANVLYEIIKNLGHSREMSIAITNLEQSVMWANKAVSRMNQ